MKCVPIVGLTCGPSALHNREKYEIYARCIREAGAKVLWIIPGDPTPSGPLLDSISALLLTGGADIEPWHYGQPLDEYTRITESSRLRDPLEIRLTREVLQAGLPVLGICRGMQVLNVALGGTLHQHVEGHCPSDHKSVKVHPVYIDPKARLARILGLERTVQVNSEHHQAVKLLAPGLVDTAWAADGTIEALESREDVWGVGVQWHPERINEVPPQMQLLFKKFVAVARKRRKRS